MSNKEIKYDDLISNLRKATPVADNADILTDEIMYSIEHIQRNKSERIIAWVRPLMTAAALFLFGMFLYQSDEGTHMSQPDVIVSTVKFTFIQKDFCGTGAKLSLKDKSGLISQYKCYLKSNRIQNDEPNEVYLKYLAKIQKDIVQ
jgi:hypothetical protein